MDLFFWKKDEKRRSFWQKGEEIAANYLRNKGYQIIERNFKNKKGRQIGEIDIIAQKGQEIVFVEVKTRKFNSSNAVLPEENITPAKLNKMNKIANLYIKQRGFWEKNYRFDAVSIWLDDGLNKHEIKHLESIFF